MFQHLGECPGQHKTFFFFLEFEEEHRNSVINYHGSTISREAVNREGSPRNCENSVSGARLDENILILPCK